MLLFLFLFGLALGAVTPSDDLEVKLERANCPMFWYSYGNRCYKYIATHFSWADAELHCVSEGANLVAIHSLDEDIFVRSLIKNFDPAQGYTWIGLSDTQKEGGWMWSDGTAVNFVNWYTDMPNNQGGTQHCVHHNYGQKWNDFSCSHISPSVCATRIKCA